MFSRTFDLIPNYTKVTHNFISFQSNLASTAVVKKIKSMGIAKFLVADKGDMTPYTHNIYEDGRLNGVPHRYTNNQCCYSTKQCKWFLYPIHPTELAAIGLTEDDLIKYIKFLNSLKCGFNYLYFGLQDGGSFTKEFVNNNYSFKGSNEYFWVGLAYRREETHWNYYYCHWIHLRYLINSTSAFNKGHSYGSKDAYYLFPRIMFYLNEVKRLPKWQSFMFAYAAGEWYYYYGLVNAARESTPFDLGLKPSEFKTLLVNSTLNGTMNNMLITENNKVASKYGIKINPRHNQFTSVKLWKEGKIDEFIAYMKKSYPFRNTKADTSKIKAVTSGKKNTTKRAKKAA